MAEETKVTVETATAIVDKLFQAVDKLKDSYGQDTARIVLETASLAAQKDLIQNGIGVILSILIIWAMVRIITRNKREAIGTDDRYSDDRAETYRTVTSWAAGFVGFFFFMNLMFSISVLTNPITWKGVHSPQHYLAFEVMKRLLK